MDYVFAAAGMLNALVGLWLCPRVADKDRRRPIHVVLFVVVGCFALCGLVWLVWTMPTGLDD